MATQVRRKPKIPSSLSPTESALFSFLVEHGEVDTFTLRDQLGTGNVSAVARAIRFKLADVGDSRRVFCTQRMATNPITGARRLCGFYRIGRATT